MNISRNYIEKILREEDIEGYIEIHGAPEDEYNSEAKEIQKSLSKLSENDFTEANVLSIVTEIWGRFFNLEGKELELRTPNLKKAVTRILELEQ